MGDQFGDGGFALGQASDDTQAVHVGHDLVEGAELAQLFGLGDGCGDRAAYVGWRWGQGGTPGRVVRRGTSTTVYINHG